MDVLKTKVLYLPICIYLFVYPSIICLHICLKWSSWHSLLNTLAKKVDIDGRRLVNCWYLGNMYVNFWYTILSTYVYIENFQNKFPNKQKESSESYSFPSRESWALLCGGVGECSKEQSEHKDWGRWGAGLCNNWASHSWRLPQADRSACQGLLVALSASAPAPVGEDLDFWISATFVLLLTISSHPLGDHWPSSLHLLFLCHPAVGVSHPLLSDLQLSLPVGGTHSF